MLKKGLIFAVVAMLAVAASAGENKWHGDWPGHWVWDPQEVTTIDVCLDIGLWVDILDQDCIELDQIDIHTYEKCKDIPVACNFDVQISAAVIPVDDDSSGDITDGDTVWTATVTGGDITAPGGTFNLCVKVENANLVNTVGGAQDVVVAQVKISVIPL